MRELLLIMTNVSSQSFRTASYMSAHSSSLLVFFKQMNSQVAAVDLEAKKTAHLFNVQTCNGLEATLDQYYKRIYDMLKQLDGEPDEQEMGLQIDLVCKNSDPTDPGVRDLASFARFDYIEKCSKA